MIRYEEIVDQLLAFFTSEKFAEDVAQGKANFFEGTGFLDEESEGFEMKMIQFGDWYIFTRPLNDTGKTPIEICLDTPEIKISAEESELISNLQAHRQSLFEFIKFIGNDIVIKDLFSNYKMTIKNTHLKFGFNKGDIFESRLIPNGDSFCFTRGFCFHPFEARKFILKRIKEIKILPEDEQKKAREKAIFKLYKMKNKYEQYAHVALERIYTEEVTLR